MKVADLRSSLGCFKAKGKHVAVAISLGTLTVSVASFANDIDTSTKSAPRYITPESAGLPKGVTRFRTGYGSAKSTTSFDSQGNALSTRGIELNATGAVFVLEQGVTDRLSAQFLVPFSVDGDLSVYNVNDFKNDPEVRAEVIKRVDEALAAFEKSLKEQFGPGWDANTPTPVDIVDPNNPNQVLIPANTPIQDGYNGVLAQRQSFIDAGLETALSDTKAALPKRTEGLGDIEVGARYSLSTVSKPWIDGLPLYTSVAAGLRLNTSDYVSSTQEGELPAGRGTTDLGLRLNADYDVHAGVQLQIENQSEMMISSGRAYDQAEAIGGEEKELERIGVRQVGYSKLVIAPGAWEPSAKAISLSLRYNWDNDPETKLGGEKVSSLQLKRSVQYGVGFDGLKYGVPVQADYDYIRALPSTNTQFATDSHQIQLKAFYKF